MLMTWCFGTRASVATVLTTHPCVSRCLGDIQSICFGECICDILVNHAPALCRAVWLAKHIWYPWTRDVTLSWRRYPISACVAVAVLACKTAVLRRIRSFVKTETLKLMHKTTIQPVMDCACFVWCHTKVEYQKIVACKNSWWMNLCKMLLLAWNAGARMKHLCLADALTHHGPVPHICVAIFSAYFPSAPDMGRWFSAHFRSAPYMGRYKRLAPRQSPK